MSSPRHAEELRRIGFEVEPFGGRAVAIHGVPNPHPRFDAAGCFREMVADLARGRFGGWANRLERFAATYACRAAVKAGQSLDERSMRELLARLFACELAAARRARPVHHRAAAARRTGAPVWPTLGRRSSSGPTAIGKTAVALALAALWPIEVVSADSRQVYRGLDIATAKPTPRERQRVPHHLIDLVRPGERYSAGRFAVDAAAAIRRSGNEDIFQWSSAEPACTSRR